MESASAVVIVVAAIAAFVCILVQKNSRSHSRLAQGFPPEPAIAASVSPTPARAPLADRYSLTPQEQQLLDKHRELFDRSLKVDIAGITIAPSRRTAMEQLAPYQFLILKREPANLHDRNAIKVKVGGNHVLGWVPRTVAREIAPELDAGRVWVAMYPHTMRGDGLAPIATMILLRVTEEIGVQSNPDYRPVLRTAIDMNTPNKLVLKFGEARVHKRTPQRAPATEPVEIAAGGAQ